MTITAVAVIKNSSGTENKCLNHMASLTQAHIYKKKNSNKLWLWQKMFNIRAPEIPSKDMKYSQKFYK